MKKLKPNQAYLMASYEDAESWDVLEARTPHEAKEEALAEICEVLDQDTAYLGIGTMAETPSFSEFMDIDNLLERADDYMWDHGLSCHDDTNFDLTQEQEKELTKKLNGVWNRFFNKNKQVRRKYYTLERESVVELKRKRKKTMETNNV